MALRPGRVKQKKFPSKDQDYALWYLIVYMRRSMYRAREKELFQMGLTPEQASVLFIVQNTGPRVTPADISRYLLREPHSVSGLLDRMEKDGLIKKVKDLERRNLVRVAITEQGKEALRKSTRRESIHRIMSCLSPGERRDVKVSLEKLWNKALEELGGEARAPFNFSD
jgi:DNA-binding MarR family transcriptional regulator